MEGRGFRDLAVDFASKNVVILGVSFDSVEENAHFAEKNHFGYPLLSDLDRSMGLAYGAADTADQAHARRVGVILTPDGRIHAWHARVSSREFPQQALTAIPEP